MSVVFSLLLFLLCISFHACDARRIGTTGKVPQTNSLLPNKSDEKMIPEATDGGGMVKQTRVDIDHKDDHSRPLTSSFKTKKMKAVQGVRSVSSQTESLVSHVSWPLPDKKRGEKQPGFNLDYLPPKTHAPVHN